MAFEHKYEQFWENNGLRVIECLSCGYKHLYPLPTDEDLKNIYEKKFGNEIRKNFSKKKRRDEKYWALAFERRLYTYEAMLNVGQVNSSKILDIGCGTGDLLAFFQKKGWHVQGIEPSQNFTEDLKLRSIPNIQKTFQDISPSEWNALGKFDIINMSMFLEHVIDPQRIVNKAAFLLKQGGILTIESPNDFNSLQMAFVEIYEAPMWWITPLHVNYFDFNSLENLVKTNCLNPVARSAQFPLEMFLHFGEQYIDNKEIGELVHQKRVNFEKNLHKVNKGQLLHQFYEKIAEIDLGRTSIIHAQKEKT